jgi:hypothetical protein
VDAALWADVQEAGAAPCVVRAPLDRFLLRGGVVRCALHDRAMTGDSRKQYRCVRVLPTARRTQHSVPSRALDEAVWSAITAFLLDPERGLAAARQKAQEAEQRLEEVVARRATLQQRLATLGEECAYLLRLARATKIDPAAIEASLEEVRGQKAQLERELAQLEAQAALAQAEVPKAEQIAAVCRAFAVGAAEATVAQRRQILDALEIEVHMRGQEYEITGSVPDLTHQGTLAGPLPNRALRGARQGPRGVGPCCRAAAQE